MKVRLDLQKIFYFTFPLGDLDIIAISKTSEFQQFEIKGESEFTNLYKVGCQVGRSRLFQVNHESRFRIFKMDPTQKCFIIEREGNISVPSYSNYALANFKDEFVFLFTKEVYGRYSLAENKWEELPIIPKESRSACSLGDKVYLLSLINRIIEVLHNPDAPVSSQEMNLQEIKVPGIVPLPYHNPVFAPLNSTEIVIAGSINTRF